ncbi:TonB-dependent receptor [Abyssalbus ytuae]|uniref:TonB-dependent receptor n=1 Tax=Abyssalbus ytuae TaxID=2926907 RepID=A0A9E7CY43_9FLAO|nr:TonB-dependent receptor [Abyssalbus ytuae]UOB16240.1 TonB-dependent receptor [Abyssalbus ytuae]
MFSVKLAKTLFVTLYVALFFNLAQSQNGTIQGVIIDNYGIYVPGASVQINSLNKGTTSNQDGKFTFVDVPEGSYSLKVKYLGYSDIDVEVTVNAGKTSYTEIRLTETDIILDDVEVVAYSLGGQSRALNTQKNNINITNVVSTEQIGKFPDANIGDAVKRIPGITMQVDQGEARNIIVRGLAPQLNSVTLNGSRIPSAEGDNRNVQMDLIPSDMIQAIEVSKAVTPDMDADALGGSVNLITRSSPNDFRLSATIGSGINFITDKRILNGSFLLGDRTKDKKFGWMISASVNDNDFGSDNIEAEWSDEFEYNTGEQDGEGEDILEELDVNPYPNVFEIRTYLVQRVRRSFSANFDYMFNNNHSLFFKSMYNWRDDRENRLRAEYEILDGEDIEAGDFEIANGNLIRFPVEVKRQTKGGVPGGRNKNARLEDQRMQNYSLGGNHLFGSLKFDWMGSYAKASEERPNERYLEYESEYIINNDFNNTKYPLYTPADATDTSLDNFEFGELTEENQYTEEKDINAFANFELPADFFGKGEGIVKFGLRGRFKDKNRENDFYEFEPVSGLETLADVDTQNYTDPDFLAGNQYQAGFFATPAFLGSLNVFDENQFEGELLPEEFETANFDVKENVFAGYLMANQKISDKLNILAGVRVESTKIESTGNEIIFDEEGDIEGVNELNQESSYTNFLPGVHFKYDVNDATVLRFAWTNTIARPNYVDLVPFREINNEDEEIIVGNTELDPTTSMNFDFMAEHYFKSVGVLSGGIFYKNVKDFIYVFVSEDETTGYDLYQPLNGDKATIFGAEVSFQRQLDFLPGFAKNFGIYLNYTYLNSDAEGIRNEDGDERGDLELPGSAPHMFNGSLSYSDKKFSARLSANFSDSYLDELGGNSFEDRYYDEQFFLDFNASFSINKNLRIYADLNNITNQPLRYYQGVKERTMQLEYYSRRLTFGLKYDLF